MGTVVILVGLMGLGLILGIFLPGNELLQRLVGRMTAVLVMLLLFTLGLDLGVREELIAQLATLGLQSLAITMLCICCSIALAWLFAKKLHLTIGESGQQGEKGGLGRAMLGSATYLLVFVAGVIVGILLVKRPWWLEQYDVTTYLLCGLMLVVGYTVGGDKASLSRIRSLSPKLLLLPLLTIVGTFVGSTLAYLLLRDFTFGEASAVGAGYGYYSLSSVIIRDTVSPESRGAMLGSVALISNICREVFSILMAGPLARWFGPLAPICSAGANSMDTTLTFIVRASGKEYAVVSVFHGVLLTVLCPVMVGIFLLL